MTSFKTILTSSGLCLIVLLSIMEKSEGRNVNSVGIEEMTSMGAGKAQKRFFDPSCEGIYDRQIFSQLEQVCENCYNLYRKPSVAAECRRDCYNSEVFDGCIRDLMLHESMDYYKGMAQMVAGRK